MNNPYRRLPPLSSLIGFEAAARLGSFSLAAEELNITQSAVSHQIKALEDHLGQSLFLRINRRVELTDAGRDLRATALKALEAVNQGVRRLEAYTKPNSVVLHMPPDIAHLWYLPRLQKLRSDYPALEPWLDTSDGEFELNETEVDITLTRRADMREGEVAAPFLEDERIALGVPQMAALYRKDPLSVPLVHDENTLDWQKWFAMVGVKKTDFVSGLNFSDSAMAMRAALDGIGICLANKELAAPLVAEGHLMEIDRRTLKSATPYRLVTLESKLKRESVSLLWEWLNGQAPIAAG